MNTFQENAENNWPEDEAVIEADYFCKGLEGNKTEKEILKKIIYFHLRAVLRHYEKVFENDSFLLRFIAEFNKHVPDFCKIPEEMQKEFCKQDDLFS